MSKRLNKILCVALTMLLFGVAIVPVNDAKAAYVTAGTEVFEVIVTDSTDGTTAVIKDTRNRKAGDVFKITDSKVKSEVGNGDTMIVTKKVAAKTGKVSYNYKAGKERITVGFVKDENTVIDCTGKTFEYDNDFGAGKIVEIVYNSKFTYDISDDTFKEARIVGSVVY